MVRSIYDSGALAASDSSDNSQMKKPLLRGKDALAHFKRVGRLIAENRVCEPHPRTLTDVIDSMVRIDPRCGKGTKDPLGGDLASHMAYIKNRRAWIDKKEGPDEGENSFRPF